MNRRATKRIDQDVVNLANFFLWLEKVLVKNRYIKPSRYSIITKYSGGES